VGYEEGGQLTEKVRRKPFSVVLFDEIEKAHHEVYNTLLQVLEDGRLTDGQGRTVSFRNAVVIMTSNLGGELWLEGKTVTREAALEVLRRAFRPEFLNRVDEIVVFHPLGKEQIARIVDIQLKRVEKLLADREIRLEVKPGARAFLGEEGWDPAYGARPLKRTIQRELQDPLAMKILQGELLPGMAVRVDRGKDGLTFTPAAKGNSAS
jgi:ATP-dependent Clp protease ATP-binding subunit ClpB